MADEFDRIFDDDASQKQRAPAAPTLGPVNRIKGAPPVVATTLPQIERFLVDAHNLMLGVSDTLQKTLNGLDGRPPTFPAEKLDSGAALMERLSFLSIRINDIAKQMDDQAAELLGYVGEQNR